MSVSYFKGSLSKIKQNKFASSVEWAFVQLQKSTGKNIWLTAQQQWMPKVVLSDNLIDLFNFLFTGLAKHE